MLDAAKSGFGTINKTLFGGGDPLTGTIDRGAIATSQAISKGAPIGFVAPEGAALANAFERGIQAITRVETGAAMPDSELQNTRTRFQPSIADPDNVIRQKVMAYQLFINNASRYIDPRAAKQGKWEDAINIDKAMSDAANLMGTNKAKPISEMSDDELRAIANGN